MTDEDRIADAVARAVGDVPVLLAGSRALGVGGERSDWDVVAVLPAWRVPLAVRRLATLSAQLTAELAVAVSVNPLPARFLRSPRRLFAWKLLREARVLRAPGGWSLPPAPPPSLSADARFSFALSGLRYLHDGQPDHARRVLAQLALLDRGEYDPLATMPAGVGDAEVGDRLRSLAQPFPASSAARTFARNIQYAVLSRLRGRSRWRAVWSREPADRVLARRALAGEDVWEEWEAAHPLMGL